MADFTSRLAELYDGKSLEQWITDTAEKYGLPTDLFKRQIQQESAFNPRAASPVGAQGLAQLMPETAKSLGVTDPFNVGQNLDAGARYLKQMYDKFGDWNWALAAYNAGPGRAERWKNQGLGIEALPYRETREYVQRIGSSVTPQQAAKTAPLPEGSPVGGPKALDLDALLGSPRGESQLAPPPTAAELTDKWNPDYDQGPLDTFLRASHIGPAFDKASEVAGKVIGYPKQLVDQAAQLAGFPDAGEALKKHPWLMPGVGMITEGAGGVKDWAAANEHPGLAKFMGSVQDRTASMATDPVMALGMIPGGIPSIVGKAMQLLLVKGFTEQAYDLVDEYKRNGLSDEFWGKLGAAGVDVGSIAALEVPRLLKAPPTHPLQGPPHLEYQGPPERHMLPFDENLTGPERVSGAYHPTGEFSEDFAPPPESRPSNVPDYAALTDRNRLPNFDEDLTPPRTEVGAPTSGYSPSADEHMLALLRDEQTRQVLSGEPPRLPEPPEPTPYVPRGKRKGRNRLVLTSEEAPPEQQPLDWNPQQTEAIRALRDKTRRSRRPEWQDPEHQQYLIEEARAKAERDRLAAEEADRLEREGMQVDEGDTSFGPPPEEPAPTPMRGGDTPMWGDKLEAERQARMDALPEHTEGPAETPIASFKYDRVVDGVNPKKVWHSVVGLDANGNEVSSNTFRTKKEALAHLKRVEASRARELPPPPERQPGARMPQQGLFDEEAPKLPAPPKAPLPKQGSLFGGELFDTTTPIRPEHGPGEGPLFTQEADRAAREQAKSQQPLFPEQEIQKGPQGPTEVKDSSWFSRLPGRKARTQEIANRLHRGFELVKNAALERLAARFRLNPEFMETLRRVDFGLDLDSNESAYAMPLSERVGHYKSTKVYAGSGMSGWMDHVSKRLMQVDGKFSNPDEFAMAMRKSAFKYEKGEYVNDVDKIFDYWKNDFERGADGKFRLKADVTPEYLKGKASALLMLHELLHTGANEPGAAMHHGTENPGARTERAQKLIDKKFSEFLDTKAKHTPEEIIEAGMRIRNEVNQIYPDEVKVLTNKDANTSGEHEQVMAGVAPDLADIAEALNLKDPNVQRLFSPLSEDRTPLGTLPEPPSGLPKTAQGGSLPPPPTLQQPSHPLGNKFNWLLEAFNMPRALATAGDLSGVLRQGIVGAARHPILTAKNIVESLRTLNPIQQKGINYFLAQENVMKSDPLFEIYKKAGGVFSDFDTLPEDAYYGSKLIRQGFRKLGLQGWDPVFASERNFTLFLNKMRMDMFRDYYQNMRSLGIAGVDANGNPTAATKQLIKSINISTGHGGQLGEGAVGQVLKGSHSLLNTAFYSPSMIRARFRLLNTALNPAEWYNIYKGYEVNAPNKAAAMKMSLMVNAAPIASFAALATGLTAATAMALGGTVETDPKSSDFMQIRKGSTRIDLTGGIRPYLVAGARLITGQTKPEYSEAKDQSRWKTIDAFMRSRYSPVLSTFRNAMDNSSYTGKDFWGPWKDVINGEEPLTPEMAKSLFDQTTGMLGDMAMPMFIRDMVQAYEEDPVTASAVALPAFLGVGLNTHEVAPGISKDLLEAMHEGQMSPFSALKAAKIPGMKDWEGKDVTARVAWTEQKKIEEGFDKNVYEALSNLSKTEEFKHASPLAKHLILRSIMTNIAGIRTRIAPAFISPPSMQSALKEAGRISPELLGDESPLGFEEE